MGRSIVKDCYFSLHSSPSVLFQKLPSDRHQLIIPEFLGPTIYLSFPSRSRFIPLPPPTPLPPPHHRPLHSFPSACDHRAYIYAFNIYIYIYKLVYVCVCVFKCERKTKQYCLSRLGETRNLKKKHHPSPNKGNQTFPRTPSRSASEATDADIISRVIQTSKKVLCTKGTSAV